MQRKNFLNNLTPLQISITQKKSTESPFSGKYNDFYEKGLYFCVCCDSLLFSSENKYNSQSGWPSFTSPINKKFIILSDDFSLEQKRTEVSCSKCSSHLGHVFNDGPPPTFTRYCINSASLLFKPN